MKNLTTFLLLVTSIILVCYSVFLNKNDDEKSTEEHVSVVSSRENDVSKSATTDIDSVYKREVNDFEKIINDTRITSLEVKNKTMPDAIEYICNELKNDKNLALPNNFNIILCDSDIHVGNVSLNIKYQSIKSMLDTLSNEFGYTYYLKNQNIYLRIKTSTLRKLKKTSNPLNNISIGNIKIEDQPMSVVVERIQEKIAESKIKVVLADSHVHVENISFNLENVSLKEILNLLKSKYGYLYDFKDSVINIRIDPIVARRLKDNMLFREKQQKQMQFGNVETLKKKRISNYKYFRSRFNIC
ncbi:MAG: hypothetical protein E7035_04200 [Verrucomicrobiaceae bacterium]|nr:hypothetical protein [Verrucomicrobiaceae bacterium]